MNSHERRKLKRAIERGDNWRNKRVRKNLRRAKRLREQRGEAV